MWLWLSQRHQSKNIKQYGINQHGNLSNFWSANLRKIVLSFPQFDFITTNSTKIKCALPQNPLQKLEIKTKPAVLKTQRINIANPQVLLQQRFGCLIFKKSLQKKRSCLQRWDLARWHFNYTRISKTSEQLQENSKNKIIWAYFLPALKCDPKMAATSSR